MRLTSREVPLDRDASVRFLPWLVAFMVYLAALALTAGMAMQKLVLRWDQGLAGRLTVQLPAPDSLVERIAIGSQARYSAIEPTDHQLFLEPEGLNTHEIYVNGMSTSLPIDVQLAILKSIPGLETSGRRSGCGRPPPPA